MQYVHKFWTIILTLKNGKVEKFNAETKGHTTRESLFEHLVKIDYKDRADIASIQLVEADPQAVKDSRPSDDIKHIMDEPTQVIANVVATDVEVNPAIEPPALV